MKSLLQPLFIRACTEIDQRVGWRNLPVIPALLVLIGLRDALRKDNLFDTDDNDPPPPEKVLPAQEYLTARTYNGSYNDIKVPSMGQAGTRFGRNVPADSAAAEPPERFMTPNPLEVSDQLLRRNGKFQEEALLNLLAAAWIQFQIHDWFSHDKDPDPKCAIMVPQPHGKAGEPMTVPATLAAPPSGRWRSTYLNAETHWWDLSQIYGSTAVNREAVRTGHRGHVKVGDELIAPGIDMFRHDGWWLGLELMSTVFMREHNAIADMLHGHYPNWNDDLIFNKARLINAALVAKIHVVEWTAAILCNPTTARGSQANWYGLAGKRAHKLFGRLSDGDVISGEPGSKLNHFDVPYALTEEFVSVYRMHQLIPDTFRFHNFSNDAVALRPADDLLGVEKSRNVLGTMGVAEALLSFGCEHPGRITLRNSPDFMTSFTRLDDPTRPYDLNAVDVLRQRERGVPRYNEFRRRLRLPEARTFADISDHSPDIAAAMAEIYSDIDEVDTVVGMYGENKPEKFGFSDTAFRIFAVMAARRIESDRFFTTDFRPEVYTPEGMAWIDDNDMVAVLRRHYPKLEPILREQKNAFKPWTAIS